MAQAIRRPEDLAHQTLLHATPRASDWQQWLEFAGQDQINTASGLIFENTNLAVHAAIEGLGVAIGIEALIQGELANGQLVCPFDIKRRSHHPIQLVFPIAKASDPLFQAIKDWLHESLLGSISDGKQLKL